VSGKEEGVAESAYNVFIKSFSKARSTKDQNGISWFESKMKIHRVAAIGYLNQPRYKLNRL